MTRPVFAANPGGWELRSPAGVLEWVAIRPKPAAIFHHARPRFEGDQPMPCLALGGECYPDAGTLSLARQVIFESGDLGLIEHVMRLMFDIDDFDREEGSAA